MVLSRHLKTILPVENHETKTPNMAMALEDILRIRKRITELYFNQKVFVTPCLSKLYLSKPHALAAESKKCRPEWCFFGTGVIAIIYDTDRRTVKLNLFDKQDVHLIWYLKWSDHIHILKDSEKFHVINSNVDEYVGILYESEHVANVTEQTITLLYSSTKSLIDENLSRCRKHKLRQSDSLPPQTHKDSQSKRRNSIKEAYSDRGIEYISKALPLPETRGTRSATVHECSGIVARRAIQNTLPNRPKSDCSDSTRLLKLKRADSFRKMRSKSFNEESSNKDNDKGKASNDEGNKKLRENILKVLFKKRRISRTQSLKVEGEKYKNEQCDSHLAKDSHGDQKQFERETKLVKPRACTDPMLLKGDWLRFVIDSGIDARDKRERKNLKKTLVGETSPSTDLCATEL